MSRAVFVLDPLPSADTVELTGPEGRHAATARRIGVGEQIVLTDGHGRRRLASVRSVGRDALTLDCAPVELVDAPARRLVAVQALAKGERSELAVELMTELGVDVIVPWAAERSIVQWRSDRADRGLERWRRTAVEAAKQSRRVWFPVVEPVASTGAVASRITTAGAALILHEDATESLLDAPLGGSGDIVVVIGPEGGIATGELDRFVEAGGTAVRLGEPILRTSTAGGAALAVLSVRLDRWT